MPVPNQTNMGRQAKVHHSVGLILGNHLPLRACLGVENKLKESFAGTPLGMNGEGMVKDVVY